MYQNLINGAHWKKSVKIESNLDEFKTYGSADAENQVVGPLTSISAKK